MMYNGFRGDYTMIMENNVEKLINNNCFVLEPVYKLTDKILASKSDKIILTGGRKVGKSTVLNRLEHRGISKDNKTINMQFDLSLILNQDRNPNYDYAFIEHYYELVISFNLLNYIKKNYPLVFARFEKEQSILSEIANYTDNFINNSWFEEVRLDKTLKWGEQSKDIIEKMKSLLHINKLNIAIDHFDWINQSDIFTQELLSSYEKLFDKMIITVDDNKINKRLLKNKLIKNGYEILNVNYSNDLDVVKRIIKKRSRYYIIKNYYRYNIIDLISDNIYEYLIDSCHGNIEMMLSAVFDIIQLTDWLETTDNFDVLFINSINEVVKKEKEYQKIYTKPKFHL